MPLGRGLKFFNGGGGGSNIKFGCRPLPKRGMKFWEVEECKNASSLLQQVEILREGI